MAQAAEVSDKDLEDDFFYQIQRMFSFLSCSQRRDYNPRPWTVAFKDTSGTWFPRFHRYVPSQTARCTGNPTNVSIQQDAEEFVNVFLDRLETRLKGTPQVC